LQLRQDVISRKYLNLSVSGGRSNRLANMPRFRIFSSARMLYSLGYDMLEVTAAVGQICSNAVSEWALSATGRTLQIRNMDAATAINHMYAPARGGRLSNICCPSANTDTIPARYSSRSLPEPTDSHDSESRSESLASERCTILAPFMQSALL
jgi:hypothetical protein